jgi:hypothetical protein
MFSYWLTLIDVQVRPIVWGSPWTYSEMVRTLTKDNADSRQKQMFIPLRAFNMTPHYWTEFNCFKNLLYIDTTELLKWSFLLNSL